MSESDDRYEKAEADLMNGLIRLLDKENLNKVMASYSIDAMNYVVDKNDGKAPTSHKMWDLVKEDLKRFRAGRWALPGDTVLVHLEMKKLRAAVIPHW